ncbi:MAG: hypothetical protein JXA89_25045 [Anaerolineae bacterium]|nr:hypothetical protein [Anaerolineae bacterium]
MCPLFLCKVRRPAKDRVVVLVLVLVVLVLLACRGGGGPSIGRLFESRVRFINHKRPDLSVSMQAFEDAGCTVEKYGVLQCSEHSPLNALPCDGLRVPTDLLGGLDPFLPIAVYSVYSEQLDPGEYFYDSSARTVDDRYPEYIRYVVFRKDRFRLVKNEEIFRGLYVPIDSPEEALSYVLAVKNLGARYGIARDDGDAYFVEVVENTHVEAVEDGYRLHLFQTSASGPSVCDPTNVSSVDVHLSFEGTIRVIDRTGVFEYISRSPFCED